MVDTDAAAQHDTPAEMPQTADPAANSYVLGVRKGQHGKIAIGVQVNEEAVFELAQVTEAQAELLMKAIEQRTQARAAQIIAKTTPGFVLEGIRTAARIMEEMPEFVKQGSLVNLGGVMRIIKREDAEAFVHLFKMRLKELGVPGIE